MAQPKRTDGQKVIGLPVDVRLLEKLDEERGGESRSSFVRRAIASELRQCGYDVPEEWLHAPDRAGKGGTPSHAKKRAAQTPKATTKELLRKAGEAVADDQEERAKQRKKA